MENTSKYKNLTTNTIIFAVANIGAKIINFLLVPLYTNVLSRAQYGTAELILNCTNIIIPIISLSISDALLRFGLDKKQDVNVILKNTSIVLLLGSVLCFILTPAFSLYDGIGQYAILFSILCVSQMIRSTLTLFAKTLGRNKLFAVDTIIYTTALAGFNILFLVGLKKGVLGYLISYVCANIVSCLFISIRVHIIDRLKNGNVDKSIFKEMLKYSIPMIANALSWWIIHFSDRVMLERMMSVDEVGLYSAAAKVPNILSTVLSVFTQAWTISAVVEYDNERDERFYSNIFKFYLLVLCLGSSAFLLFIKPFMFIYVGKSFTDSWIYVPLLILATVYGAISSFTGPIYGAAKKNIAATVTTVLGGIVNIVFNFLLIKKFGIMGAVVATLIADFFMGIVRLYDTRRFYKFEINMLSMWVTLICVSIQSICVTLEFHPVIISFMSIIIISFANKSVFVQVINMSVKALKRRRL